MERRFAERKEAMLAECEVSPQVFAGVAERLAKFVEPFAALLRQPAQREHAADYVGGLLSDLERKNVESIAYRCDQDRRDLQHFVGCAPWDHRPLMTELARQVGAELGEDDGVVVFDPSAFPKKGTKSVGAQRQWCGRLGKVDNCQVAVYLAYVSRIDHALVNCRLYLPKEWAKDRARRKAAGVPKEVRFQTRHAQALAMLAECGDSLPHAWIAGDDEMGRSGGFRRDLHGLGEHYLLAVPCDTLIRDLDAPTPEYGGRGRLRKTPFQRVDQWRDALAEEAWTRINVRDGEKGPLSVEVATCRVRTKSDQRIMKYDETLVVVRSLGDDGATKYDFYLSNAAAETPKKEFARVALAAHRIEEAIKRGKSEAGLAHYEVRHWLGWHHHQTLSLVASWFLVREALRGKKNGPRRSPSRRFAMASPSCCERTSPAIRPHKSPAIKHAAFSETN
ncbi:MAG: IS701 family transposase [Pirellulales bacterium]|nr:IS701 family transposase [Pirellulales bacterium]